MKSTLNVDLTFLKQIQVNMSSNLLVHDIKNNSSKPQDTSKFEFKENLFYFKRHLYIPKGKIRLHAPEVSHNFLATGHFGYNKSLEFISRDFWWSQI